MRIFDHILFVLAIITHHLQAADTGSAAHREGECTGIWVGICASSALAAYASCVRAACALCNQDTRLIQERGT